MILRIVSSSFRSFKSGFTLIELLVAVSIMAIILGITLSGGPQAIMRLTLSNNAYETELLIREAQVQGSAINSLNGTYGGIGVYFNRATATQALKFKDRVDPALRRAIGIGNGLYESTPEDEKDSIFSFSNNNRIGKLCVATSTQSTSSIMCNEDNALNINTLTIAFERPKQEAHIYINDATTTDYLFACIQIDSNRSPTFGFVKSIFVYRSGMITKNSRTCQS